jgi:hypothetical protein
MPQIDYEKFDQVKSDLSDFGIEYAIGTIKCNKLKP